MFRVPFADFTPHFKVAAYLKDGKKAIISVDAGSPQQVQQFVDGFIENPEIRLISVVSEFNRKEVKSDVRSTETA